MLSALLSFRGVLSFWIVYGVAHAALRLSVSRTLTLDDSRASELVQTLSLGYQVRQPPLYEWLLWCSQQAFGVGIESHLVVRYTLIAALGVATFAAARAAVKDERWAAAASLSLMFSYPVAWTFHEWATQTILLSIACMATLAAALRYFERPGVGAAVLLGLALTLGAYSKFSFPLFLGGLLLAAMRIGETRARLADARLLISVAIAAVAFAPFAYWIVQVRGDVVSELSSHLIVGGQSHGVRVALGLWRLGTSIPIFLLPWIVFVAVLAAPAFRRAPASAPPPSIAEQLALWSMVFAALLAAAGIAASGATNVAERYMHPILMVAPVYAFARIVRLAPGEDRLHAFAATAAIMALTVFAIRFIGVTDNPLTRQAGRRLLMPYAELAETLRARGVADGTVVTPQVRDAGNLRAFIPELRVIAGESQRVGRVPRRESDARSCILIWPQGREAEARRFAPIGPLDVERLKIEGRSSGIIARRSGTWFIARLDPRSNACQ